VKKYEPIIEEANGWLQANLEEICIKHKVSRTSVDVKYVLISNLDIVPKSTEVDVCNIVSSHKKEKLSVVHLNVMSMQIKLLLV
jgi:hypothetical protein